MSILWEGMGYYRRAHNLHRSARTLRERYGGKLPDDASELLLLPGIGRYTAAAIAALAFGQDMIALDGNIRRVLSRLFDLEIDPRSPQGERILLERAREAFPVGKASAFNQALMDLGATVCVPRSPACDRCPLASHCQSLHRGVQEDRPVRRPRPQAPQRQIVAGVLIRGNKVLLGRRASDGLLGGLWGYPQGELLEAETPRRGLRRILNEALDIRVAVGQSLPSLKHAYTHFQVEMHPFLCSIRSGRPKADTLQELSWVALSELDRHPMGKLDRRISMMLPGSDSISLSS